MDGREFKAWRERVGITQQGIAERLGVTRTTVQNWESVSQIPQAVAISCRVWEARLRREDPNLGPVTLIYSDAPMFVNPHGPRHRSATIQQEPYPTNAAAIARVQKLSDRSDFCNPFIIEKSGKPLWDSTELQNVINGTDTGAPTLANLLKVIAKHVRLNSANFVRNGPRMPSLSELEERKRAIEHQAERLEGLVAE